jgi:hypothetical protein
MPRPVLLKSTIQAILFPPISCFFFKKSFKIYSILLGVVYVDKIYFLRVKKGFQKIFEELF